MVVSSLSFPLLFFSSRFFLLIAVAIIYKREESKKSFLFIFFFLLSLCATKNFNSTRQAVGYFHSFSCFCSLTFLALSLCFFFYFYFVLLSFFFTIRILNTHIESRTVRIYKNIFASEGIQNDMLTILYCVSAFLFYFFSYECLCVWFCCV